MINQQNKTKAEVLQFLKLKVKKSLIPNFIFFKAENFLKTKKSIISNISKTFDGQLVAVRSSSYLEDGTSTSYAGKFETVLNVISSDYEMVSKAIEKVINSFSISGKSFGPSTTIAIATIIKISNQPIVGM